MENKKLVRGLEWMARIQGALIIGLYAAVKGTYIIFTMITPDAETAEIIRPYLYLGIFVTAVVVALNVFIHLRIRKARTELLQKLGV